MIYGPSWLQADAILDEYRAPTPPTRAPPAEALPSQAAFCASVRSDWKAAESNCKKA